jgi:hypothetical protein
MIGCLTNRPTRARCSGWHRERCSSCHRASPKSLVGAGSTARSYLYYLVLIIRSYISILVAAGTPVSLIAGCQINTDDSFVPTAIQGTPSGTCANDTYFVVTPTACNASSAYCISGSGGREECKTTAYALCTGGIYAECCCEIPACVDPPYTPGPGSPMATPAPPPCDAGSSDTSSGLDAAWDSEEHLGRDSSSDATLASDARTDSG